MKDSPITYTWNGEAMVPLPRLVYRCNKEFVVGEQYSLAINEERSTAAHAHYFAAVNDAWGNLSDEYKVRYPSAAHLRKWALIRAGYHFERTVVCDTVADAERLQAFVKPIDEFAVVIRRENVVRVFTAKSQKRRHMDKKEFAESKERVLAILAEVIGVKPKELSDNARNVA